MMLIHSMVAIPDTTSNAAGRGVSISGGVSLFQTPLDCFNCPW